jgi:uncharacterized protein (TIGR00251 family)
MPKSKKPDNDARECVITFHVTPRSSRCRFLPVRSAEYRAKLTAPLVNGAANDQLVQVLAKTLDVTSQNVTIISGTTSRIKRVRIRGLDQKEVEKLLKD